MLALILAAGAKMKTNFNLIMPASRFYVKKILIAVGRAKTRSDTIHAHHTKTLTL